MIQALAPRMPRGISWVWLAIVAVTLWPGASLAQTPPAPKADEKRPAENDDKPVPKPEPAEEEPAAEVFMDPNAKRTLAIFSPMNYNGPQINLANAGGDRTRVLNMVSGAENIAPDFLKRYIEFFAIELTKRDNINALLNLPPPLAGGKAPEPKLRNLELAVNALTKPIIDARHNNNQEFLSLYTRFLFESSLPKILGQ